MSAWRLVAALSLLVGAYSLRYALPHVPLATTNVNFLVHHRALVVHAVSASFALLLGPWQLLDGLRRRYPRLHRVMGRAYAAFVLVAGLAALWMAPTASAGWVSSAGFGALAVGWLVTTSLGVVHILRRDVAAHRRWMLRSFALTTAAITLRLYLPLVLLFHWRFGVVYPVISWICWVPNFVAVEIWLRGIVGRRTVGS